MCRLRTCCEFQLRPRSRPMCAAYIPQCGSARPVRWSGTDKNYTMGTHGYSPLSAWNQLKGRQRRSPIRRSAGLASTPSSAALPAVSTPGTSAFRKVPSYWNEVPGRQFFLLRESWVSNGGRGPCPDLVYHIILRFRQILKRLSIKFFAERAGLELCVVICKCFRSKHGKQCRKCQRGMTEATRTEFAGSAAHQGSDRSRVDTIRF